MWVWRISFFRFQKWDFSIPKRLFADEKWKKNDPKSIRIGLGTCRDNFGWDKMILGEIISSIYFRSQTHISDPKLGLYETKKWSDVKKRAIIRRRLVSSTLLQNLSTIGTVWVPPERPWHPKRFLTRFRSENENPDLLEFFIDPKNYNRA
jgi:hypothetical protein